MARKITDAPVKPIQGYKTNEAPYELLIDQLCRKYPTKSKRDIEKEVQNTYTYYYICEQGSYCIVPWSILTVYEAEQKDGLFGFLKALGEEKPNFILPYLKNKGKIK